MVSPQAVVPKEIEVSKPAAAGKTNVIVDANGERASVSEVSFIGPPRAENVKRLCVAPCVVELAPGPHVLRFADERDATRASDTRIDVDEKPRLVRHAMGRTEKADGWNKAGWALFLGGAGVVGIGGLLADQSASGEKFDPDMLTAAIATAVVGGTLALVGIPMMIASRPQTQQGATTEVKLARR
ncbi:MAG: hypothetical protein KF819_11565 [Labilithrix sp.]|nr:hypothetical protein [Labilithrix sp.]